MPPRKSESPRSDDDAQARGKKKKKPAGPRWPLYAGIAAGGLVVLLLVIGVVIIGIIFGVKAFRGTPAEPVAKWSRYNSAENEFGFDYPTGWHCRESGIKNKRGVIFSNSGTTITVKENMTGSLIGDIAGAANFGKEVSDERSPVAKVHELRKPEGAKEEPAVTVTTKAGKARRSLYTDGSRRGYRATVLLHQTALDIFCECHESDWETLRPAFERLIESVARGG